MKTNTTKPLHMIPPILFPLSAYILSVVVFWGLFKEIIPPLYVLFYGLALIAILISIYQKNRLNIMIFVALAAFLGLARGHQTVSYYQSFPFHVTEKGVAVEGHFQSYSFQGASRLPFCSTISIEKIDTLKKPFAPYIIRIYTKKKLAAQINDRVKIENIILKKPKNDSFYSYLMKEGIAATAFQDQVKLTVESHPSFSVARWLFHSRQAVLRSFQKSLNKETFQLFAAIFLGEKEVMKRNKETLEGPFKQWGIVHYLARSGLHLVIIVSLCALLLKCAPAPFAVKQILLLAAVLFYSLLSWSSISFIRALLIFLMYTYCQLSRTPNHFLQLLLLCCFILLLINPLYLLFLDFQLSFGLTFALAWLNLFRTVSPAHN